MPNRLLPLGDTDFWWLRYGLGAVVPLVLVGLGLISVVTQFSYTFERQVGFVQVEGEQAVLMGFACYVFALALFASCYAQYHETMSAHHEGILGLGAVLGGGAFLWCSLLFLYH